MSVKTIATCNRCGDSWELEFGYGRRELHAIEVKVQNHTYWKTVGWCNKCVDSFKMFQPEPPPGSTHPQGVVVDTRPTSVRLEELIREIAGGQA